MQQPQDMAGWVSFLSAAEIPVLRQTARELERMHADEDNLNARSIAHVVSNDPLMTAKLLRYLQAHKHHSQSHELVQVEQAIMMMGLSTFFRDVPASPVVEDMLHDHMDALIQLLHVIHRAQRSAKYAFDWALLLHDLHADEVRVSSLLTYLSETLMWCFNPEQMLEIRHRQETDKTLRSAAVQGQVLGFRGIELQRALAMEWQLPALLLDLTDPSKEKTTRVENVIFAVNLTRHSANGWDDAALPDDYRDIGTLLRMDPEKVREMVCPAEPETSPAATS